MTTVEKVFCDLRTPLLARLARNSNLLFAGRRDYLDYLAEYFGGASPHAYIESDAPPDAWMKILSDRKTIVVVSDDEEEVTSKVKAALDGLDNPPQIVRLFADLFVNANCGGNPWKWGPPTLTSPKEAYAILSTPRAGTEFLCEALASTKLAGYPKEHLRSQSEALTRFCHFDADRYLHILMSRLVTPNQIFGTKLIAHFLVEHIRLCPPLGRTLARIKYIRVYRRDLVGQAISAMLAAKTGTYHIRNDDEKASYQQRLIESGISAENVRDVNNLRKDFSAQRRQMDEFLERNSITPLDIAFEDLIEQPVQSVNAVLAFLNVPTRVDNIAVTVRKTQNKINETVRAMYLEESWDT